MCVVYIWNLNKFYLASEASKLPSVYAARGRVDLGLLRGTSQPGPARIKCLAANSYRDVRLRTTNFTVERSQGLIHWAMTDTIQGGPEKTERDTSYVDAMTGISVWGNFSWKKMNQDQQFWFSSWYSRAHFVRQCWGPIFQNFPFQLKVGLKMPFQLAIVVSSNPN